MTNRVIFDSHGLRISEPGVDVLTASSSQLRFDASDRSVPLLIRGAVALPGAYGAYVSIGYGRDFGHIPPSTLMWSDVHPSVAGSLTIMSEMGTSTMWVQGLTGITGNGNTQYLFWRRFSDRVEFHQEKGVPGGAAAAVLGGWVSALVFDYGVS
jgi:hypothetical protein